MRMREEISQALAARFAIPDAGAMTVVTTGLAVAVVLGGALGLGRESKGRAAGLKTHILASLGSALFVLAPLQAGVGTADVTRVMQGIVSGIGFLGPGAILKLDQQARVQGLATAAGIWMTAAIGMAAGMGMQLVALATTLAALLVVQTIPRLMPAAPH